MSFGKDIPGLKKMHSHPRGTEEGFVTMLFLINASKGGKVRNISGLG